ncbi:YbaB/EbfC family nucleoid-associated protein [Nocardia fluminea]|uniref:YbaB/EbfC family nucleoid-associated protein n=1 Tax=Nocardia fluminea TaxID=134984 RepID=UPI0034444D21
MEDAESARLEHLQEALLRIRGTASSSDQSVTVEVGANGALHDVRLSESGLRLDSKLLVDHIIGLHRLAYAEASDAMRATVEDMRAETPAGDDSERIDDPDESESDSDTPQSASATSPEPGSTDDEKSQEKIPPQTHDPQPDPAPGLSPDASDRVHDAPQVADVPSGDPLDRMAHVIRPYAPSGEGVNIYDPIEPGEDNPYAAVIASPPPPRRVPWPRPASSTSDVDAADRSEPQPIGLPWHGTTVPHVPALPPNQDYPEYDYPGYDYPGHDYHWDLYGE